MGRTLLLFDPNATPQSWNERMSPGEYAVLFSGPQPLPEGDPEDLMSGREPACVIFTSLAEAEQFAAHSVERDSTIRCRVYDHEGLAHAPVRELRGGAYKGESEITARFRRWCGSILFFGGIGLFAMDWVSGFRMSWPGMLGSRMFPAGLVLLVIELVIVIEARRVKRRAAQ
jgi:hypothetical protein